jgi:hypothetical protein
VVPFPALGKLITRIFHVLLNNNHHCTGNQSLILYLPLLDYTIDSCQALFVPEFLAEMNLGWAQKKEIFLNNHPDEF